MTFSQRRRSDQPEAADPFSEQSDPSSTRLIVIRHGHIEGNGELHARMVGWTDVPLSSLGRLESEQLGRRLSGGPRFDAIYSSPLSRATDTASMLVDAGLGPLHLRPALKEIHCGEVDGLPVEEVQRKFPELWRENFSNASASFRWPGGESYREFRERCLAAVQAVIVAHPSGRVALVTHAGVISQILGSIHDLSPGCWQRFRPGNASISELAWSGSGGEALSFDDRSHLI